LRFCELAGEGHIQVDGATYQKEARPAQVQAIPGRFRHVDLPAHQLLHEVAPEKPLAAQQGRSENPVQNGGLPLDEGVILEEQGGAAKDDDDPEVDPVHGLDGLATQLQPQELKNAGGDGYGGGRVDVCNAEGNEEQD